MNKAVAKLPIEPRWPVALAIVAVLILLRVLPERVRLGPVWLPFVPGLVVLAALVAVPVSGAAVRWLRIERFILLLFCLVQETATVISLAYLIREMIHQSTALDGLQLLTSSIAIWITNLLVFSLLYWQMGRGRPHACLNPQPPDWLFP